MPADCLTGPAASLASAAQQIAAIPLVERWGRLEGASGAALVGLGFRGSAVIGERVRIERQGRPVSGEVVAFSDERVTIMPEGDPQGLAPGARIWLEPPPILRPSEAWLGRVIDGLGRPLDGKGPLALGPTAVALRAIPPPALERRLVGARLETGIRVLDAFVPLCRGQRLGIFAGSGVGKSTLLGMLARFMEADVVVVGLIGERGREVREFLDGVLQEALARTVVVVSTSDQPAVARRRAALATLGLAEWLRDQGRQVLCLLDSITRLAHAQREIGLAAGEPATARSYTPSVFTELPALLERAGPGTPSQGDITGVFTVLVDGDDHDEPIADAVRGILDGHVVLSRAIGLGGRWPAVDPVRSVSRALPRCHSPAENALLGEARRLLSTYESMEDMVRLGVYRPGSDPMLDVAIMRYPALEAFLAQDLSERSTSAETFARLAEALGREPPC